MSNNSFEHIYVHVPFCSRICPFCDFPRRKAVCVDESWFEVICQEAESLGQTLQREAGHKDNKCRQLIRSIYFGGGSPALLEAGQLDRLLSFFREYLHPQAELTIELNPEQCTPEKLRILRALGFNRLSIGIQSFDENRLKSIGRNGPVSAEKAIGRAREAGFENLSIDLIYSWPGQSFEELVFDLYRFIGLDIDHLSIYSLQIEEGSAFGKAGIEPLDEEMEAACYTWISSFLKRYGYEHYEISSFARNNRRSVHNMGYWSDHYYAAIGYGAAGYDGQGYYQHADSLEEYLDNPGRIYLEEKNFFNAIMMGLRTNRGIDRKRFERNYGFDMARRFAPILDRYRTFFEISPDFIRLNEAGRNILHTILVEFMD